MIFILESSKRFKRILISGTKEQMEVSITLTIDLSQNTGFDSVFELLNQNKFSSMIMNENGIIALEAGNEVNQLIATTMSTRSDLNLQHTFLGFDDDRKF